MHIGCEATTHFPSQSRQAFDLHAFVLIQTTVCCLVSIFHEFQLKPNMTSPLASDTP